MIYIHQNRFMTLNKVLVISVVIAVAIARNYPMYKQCDDKWAKDQLGTSKTETICSAGCLISSVSMALSGLGTNYNPKTMNDWLKKNNGYVREDNFVFNSVDKLGAMKYKQFIHNNNIKSSLDAGNVVILHVHKGTHYVLATGYNGDNIHVHDPYYNTTSYTLADIENGDTAEYTVTKLPYTVNYVFETVKQFIYELLGIDTRVFADTSKIHIESENKIKEE